MSPKKGDIVAETGNIVLLATMLPVSATWSTASSMTLCGMLDTLTSIPQRCLPKYQRGAVSCHRSASSCSVQIWCQKTRSMASEDVGTVNHGDQPVDVSQPAVTQRRQNRTDVGRHQVHRRQSPMTETWIWLLEPTLWRLPTRSTFYLTANQRWLID